MVSMINELKLDLACGDNKREGYKGIDVAKTDSVDYVADLQQYPWPIESESAEEVNCSHYIEHIKHDNVALDLAAVLDKSESFEEFKKNINDTSFLQSKDGFIKFFNELYRIMKKGGKATIVSPYYTSIRGFGDPTHTRYLGEWSFYYLNKEWRDLNKLSHYGLECDFDIKYSYYITNEMTLKSDEVRDKAFKHDWNVVDDILVDLIKR